MPDANTMVRLVRVFVSSPGDVAKERACLDEVVERINTTARGRDFRLEVWKWEDELVSQIGPPPQKVVDDQTPTCDIYLGIMSTRFGGDRTRGSGTESELRDALKRWGATGRPWILFYFDDEARGGRPRVAALLFSMGKSAVQGFSLAHDRAPVIAINTAWREEARIFTLFHELGHLVTGTSSACVGTTVQPADPIERWCEAFAAEVLAPKEMLIAQVKAVVGSVSTP